MSHNIMISSSLITQFILVKFIFDNYHLLRICYDGGYYVYYFIFLIKSKLFKKNKKVEIEDDYVIL